MAEPPPNMSTSLQLNNIPKGGYKVTITTADGTTVFHQEIKHPSQITLNIGDTHPDHPVENAIQATTFPKFSLLPSELRVKIWGFSLDQPRIFWPNHDKGDTEELQGMSFSHRPPAVRQVCRESRKVSDRRGRFSFGTCGTHLSSLWFDFHSDIIFSNEAITLEERELTDHVRNVAVWHNFCRDIHKAEELQGFLRDFPKCQKIIFVWSGVLMEPYGDIKFYPIQDDEPIEGRDKNWKSLKTRINRAWRKDSFLKKCKLSEDQLPIIEAAECKFVERECCEKRYEEMERNYSITCGSSKWSYYGFGTIHLQCLRL
ncbi:hypothetical protein NW768_006417 [Fusarium equiseti]|uniref:2EXR domain-containing protein n=1 Tax=Fusarium equiseti TaxID=61235 RepID=A0ABQ8RBH6_FUSEQ|nr:hypothetical protein NW768_006417 [Fusarium equiseti]